jgi:hypothetical protein
MYVPPAFGSRVWEFPSRSTGRGIDEDNRLARCTFSHVQDMAIQARCHAFTCTEKPKLDILLLLLGWRKGKFMSRPSLGKFTSRPSLGKFIFRPSLGKLTPRPSLGKITSRPRLGKFTSRPSLGKYVRKFTPRASMDDDNDDNSNNNNNNSNGNNSNSNSNSNSNNNMSNNSPPQPGRLLVALYGRPSACSSIAVEILAKVMHGATIFSIRLILIVATKSIFFICPLMCLVVTVQMNVSIGCATYFTIHVITPRTELWPSC